MSKKLSSHFKCPRSLKTRLALVASTRNARRAIMAAEAHAKAVEWVSMTQLVPLPRGMKEKAS